jgi:hypothetical protein
MLWFNFTSLYCHSENKMSQRLQYMNVRKITDIEQMDGVGLLGPCTATTVF